MGWKWSAWDGNTSAEERWRAYRSEVLEFINEMHGCAPEGTVYSWLQSCEVHHLTRNHLNDSSVPAIHGVELATFVKNFIKDKPPSQIDEGKNRFSGITADVVVGPLQCDK